MAFHSFFYCVLIEFYRPKKSPVSGLFIDGIYGMRLPPPLGIFCPLTTGPTGTTGGAKLGIFPVPMTRLTVCVETQIRKPGARAVAMASNTVS